MWNMTMELFSNYGLVNNAAIYNDHKLYHTQIKKKASIVSYLGMFWKNWIPCNSLQI